MSTIAFLRPRCTLTYTNLKSSDSRLIFCYFTIFLDFYIFCVFFLFYKNISRNSEDCVTYFGGNTQPHVNTPCSPKEKVTFVKMKQKARWRSHRQEQELQNLFNFILSMNAYVPPTLCIFKRLRKKENIFVSRKISKSIK